MKNSFVLLCIIAFISIFASKQAFADDIKPTVSIESIETDNNNDIDTTNNEVIIPHNVKKISLNLKVENYSDSYNGKVLYYFEGIDNKPVEINSDLQVITYANLKGGKYKFHTLLTDNNGKVIDEHILQVSKELNIFEYKITKILILTTLIVVLIIVYRKLLVERTRKLNENHKRYEKLVDETITAIANTIDAKDKDTNGHSQRVAKYSAKIARRMGIDEEMVKVIYYTGLLHDIGKIGIPDKILNKPSGLNDKEYEIIKRHTIIGGDILNEITIVNNIADGARYHHEKYDGTGYPFGLKGEDIPLVARIIGVADTYDAMHSDRVYRKGLSYEYILEEFKRCAGKQLDPEITKIAIELIEEKLQEEYKKSIQRKYIKSETQI